MGKIHKILRLDLTTKWFCICPALGPRGVWSAHGKVWLLRYERGWQDRFTTLQHPSFCLSYHSLPYSYHMSSTSTQHLANTCVCTFSPRLLSAKRLVQEGKVFDCFFLEMTACRISLESGWWSFFSPTPPRLSPHYTTVNCSELLSPSCHLCEVSGRAALITQSDQCAFPRLHHTEPGHHANLEAAEELCLSDPRSPPLVSVHGSRKCWQHGLQYTERWVGNITVNMSVICELTHFYVVLQMLSHSLINWTCFCLYTYCVSSLCS